MSYQNGFDKWSKFKEEQITVFILYQKTNCVIKKMLLYQVAFLFQD